MPSVKNVGKPCAGEPHARFDGRELETEQTSRHGHGEERHCGKPCGHQGSMSYRRSTRPRQFPTLPISSLTCWDVADVASNVDAAAR